MSKILKNYVGMGILTFIGANIAIGFATIKNYDSFKPKKCRIPRPSNKKLAVYGIKKEIYKTMLRSILWPIFLTNSIYPFKMFKYDDNDVLKLVFPNCN